MYFVISNPFLDGERRYLVWNGRFCWWTVDLYKATRHSYDLASDLISYFPDCEIVEVKE